MVRIFRNKDSGDFVVQTTCIDSQSFLADLSEAISNCMKANADDMTCYGILQNAMPIAYKLSGYKADEVSEQRTLVCGQMLPNQSDLLATAGK